jgi:hypothetical protein
MIILFMERLVLVCAPRIDEAMKCIIRPDLVEHAVAERLGEISVATTESQTRVVTVDLLGLTCTNAGIVITEVVVDTADKDIPCLLLTQLVLQRVTDDDFHPPAHAKKIKEHYRNKKRNNHANRSMSSAMSFRS